MGLVKIVAATQRKGLRKKSLSRFVDKTENTDSADFKVHATDFKVHELLVRFKLSFKNFCKLAKQAETIRNN